MTKFAKGHKGYRPRLATLSKREEEAYRKIMDEAYPFKAKTWKKTTKDWHKAVYGAGKD